MKRYNLTPENRKQTVNFFIIFMVITIAVAAVCFQYYQRLHSTIREESRGYVQEISRLIGSNIDRIIKDSYAVLNTMAASVESEGKETFGEVTELLQKQQAFWNYENIMFLDDAGKAYDLHGAEVFLKLDSTVLQAILKKENEMSTSQIINNEEFIVFTVPMDGVVLNNKKMVALAASYSPNGFDQTLSMTSFNDKAYSQIITKSGTAVTRSTFAGAIKTGYNIFTSLEKATLEPGKSLEQIKDEIRNDRGDQVTFKLDGVEFCMVYTPIQPDEWYLLSFIPIKVINEKSDMLLKTTLFICGMITFVFSIFSIILVVIFSNNKKKLEDAVYVDDVSSGYTIKKFYQVASNIVNQCPNSNFALVYTNFEKFKVLNDQLGRETCDEMLKVFYQYITSDLSEKECMGRIFADNFCLLLEYENDVMLIERFRKWRVNSEEYMKKQSVIWGMPGTEFGIYVIQNHNLTFPQMIDRAKLAIKESLYSIDSKLKYAFYDDEVRRKLYKEKQLEDKMESALANGEFKVYLQPKYHLPEEKIKGAEALVRWISPESGMIFPNDFIPLFEKNMFIIELDLFMFEQVCMLICSWKEKNREPIKISVNCSRIVFKSRELLSKYITIANQYGVDKSLIEIELTESIVFENSAQLIEHIQFIRDAGFGCSMDDFGSGYSSLNLVQQIPVDTIKIDKIFFNSGATGINRTEAVVKSIVSMANSFGMETVAEGVEYTEQIEMLKNAGCNYIQGYVYARPMPVSDFEELTFKKQ